MSSIVLIIGLGDVGAWALEFLARASGVAAIAVADIRESWGRTQELMETYRRFLGEAT